MLEAVPSLDVGGGKLGPRDEVIIVKHLGHHVGQALVDFSGFHAVGSRVVTSTCRTMGSITSSGSTVSTGTTVAVKSVSMRGNRSTTTRKPLTQRARSPQSTSPAALAMAYSAISGGCSSMAIDEG